VEARLDILTGMKFSSDVLRRAAACLTICLAAAGAVGGAGGQTGNPEQAVKPGQQGLPGARGTQGTTSKGPGASKPAAGENTGGATQSAVAHLGPLDPLAPAPAPAKVFARPRIGLAMGGGGALGLSESGTLQWFEENHIPVDVIAGTSMGCMISALYSTGQTPAELMNVMNDQVFARVFSFSNSYTSRSFRRREDSRELPNGVTVGLKHGVSFRNAVLTDEGLNAFLDRQFLRYNDRVEFNALPIPLRCVSTDLNTAESVVFARGSIPDAVRASVSLPAVYQPFLMNGHEYVDGGVLQNLPTPTLEEMKPDVVLAISLPLEPVEPGGLSSLLGVLGRSFSVAIEGAERKQRKLADVVIMPDLKGFTTTDYLKTKELAKRGYAATEAHRAELLKYALNDADWAAYIAHREGLRRGPAGPVLRVRVVAPSESATLAVQKLFAPLVNQPVDTRRIEAILSDVRADGRYEADYTVGYETAADFAAQQVGKKAVGKGAVDAQVATRVGLDNATPQPGPESRQALREADISAHPGAAGMARTRTLSNTSLEDVSRRPVILVTVTDKSTGPPFVVVGTNVEAQTAGRSAATVEAILLDQDLGGYGSELRTHIKLGYLTDLNTEYFHPFNAVQSYNRRFFIAPRAGLLRQPFPIYVGQRVRADRQLQELGGGVDAGVTNSKTQELRVGAEYERIHWTSQIGTDGLPSYFGNMNRARLQYQLDNQDGALVPQFGVNVVAEAAYLFDTVGSPNTPQLSLKASYAHRFHFFEEGRAERLEDGKEEPRRRNDQNPQRGREVFILGGEGGTMFGRDVAQPFRYTLGGPVRLAASALDQYRGTDYGLVQPALLFRIAELPQPLGQSIYVGGGLEYGFIRAPAANGIRPPSIQREDGFFGLVAETPLGVISAGPAIGSNGDRKFIFTLGRLF
jgi:NTE family protein